LADYAGKSALVLAWYPRAFTSGCTIECKSLTEDGHLIRAFEIPYFMASVDPIEENTRFAKEMKADFPILSDPTKETARAYGVLHQDRFALRTTFYIGSDGRILRIDRNVDPATAARDIARSLEELGFPRAATDAPKAVPPGSAQ
jgi:peroxiredoxin Q/BCP